MHPSLKHYAPLVLCVGLALPAGAEDLRLSLDQSVQAAMDYSPRLKAAQFDLEAASAHASSVQAALLPHIGLDGRYDYIAQIIPAINLPPQMASTFGIGQLDFGFHNEYSVGVSADWDIFSTYSNWKQAQVAKKQRRELEAQLDDVRQNLRLDVRLAYFQTQAAETRVRLYAEALKLSQSQLHDMNLRLKAGSSSRIDWLTASNDELDQRASYRLAQAELAAALRDLFALTGQNQDADVALPVDGADAAQPPADTDRYTVAVTLDDTPALLSEFADAERAPFKPRDVASLRMLWAAVRTAQSMTDAAFAGHMPTGGVGFRWSYDYPELPLAQGVDQQTTSANFNLPLFAFGQVQDQVDAQKNLALAAGESASDAEVLTKTEWLKGHDRLAGLGAQRAMQKQETHQTKELRDMVYRSYKIGGSTFLQVQSTSLEALQAGLTLAQTETQMLIELANLSALTDSPDTRNP